MLTWSFTRHTRYNVSLELFRLVFRTTETEEILVDSFVVKKHRDFILHWFRTVSHHVCTYSHTHTHTHEHARTHAYTYRLVEFHLCYNQLYGRWVKRLCHTNKTCRKITISFRQCTVDFVSDMILEIYCLAISFPGALHLTMYTCVTQLTAHSQREASVIFSL